MNEALPRILAGPIVRHTSEVEFSLCLVTTRPCNAHLVLSCDGEQIYRNELNTSNLQELQLGRHCFVQLIHIHFDEPLPVDKVINYDLIFDDEQNLKQLSPSICYEQKESPFFTVPNQLKNILHGSCRKPHHDSPDGLLEVDQLLEPSHTQKPNLLLLTGDQIYADDVAGPVLHAIHQLIDKLGLLDERFDGATVADTQDLLNCPDNYYRREHLLPKDKANRDLLEKFFGGVKKPIFTSAGAHNHLITFSEVVSLYLLTWSPVCWRLISLDNPPQDLTEECCRRYENERKIIRSFIQGLDKVQRSLAHIPTYMIFDDHDISDDWNLTRGWEEAAYNNPFSRRIIGNTLLAYCLFQGWGNRPSVFSEFIEELKQSLSPEKLNNHDNLINTLLSWDDWHYEIQTNPPIVVLDTRTHRWRSEDSPNKPSGLMDWESLCELQQKIIQQERVILISPSPIFGVKLVETVQRIFTFFGFALTVDAENWMAHPGSASAILNIFCHRKTPPQFIILSGDVHYSFAYDIRLRMRKNSPQILQVTASGLKNRFPNTLLTVFDYVNRFFYSPYSPLNWFTKRKRMKIKNRKIVGNPSRTLLNQSGIGQLILHNELEKTEVYIRGDRNIEEFK